jgi:ribonuclease G
VGLVEDDLLAEIYLERENEYTLAGSIYKGRVTRVLPGMQSAFVDIGLERDAFLYVSDFMELEEHDEDLTDVVPASRGVQDMRMQPQRKESSAADMQTEILGSESQAEFDPGSGEGSNEGQESAGKQAFAAGAAGAESLDSGSGSQDRERGSYRGRRRRRGRSRLFRRRLFRLQLRVRRAREERSSLVPPQVISRYFCPENRFRSTGDWRLHP